MVRSAYKGERLGKRPACALCLGAGEGERRELHLGYGVSVWLCAAHRSDGFQRRRAGRDLVASLDALWSSAGCLTARRRQALTAYRERIVAPPAATDLPGSYSWPDLRREAERRFAAGDAPWRVIGELRAAVDRGAARAPSVRTMRRWFTDGRWRSPPRCR